MQKTVCQDALEENFLHEEDEKDIFRRNVQIFHIVVSSIVESTFLILTKFSFPSFSDSFIVFKSKYVYLSAILQNANFCDKPSKISSIA